MQLFTVTTITYCGCTLTTLTLLTMHGKQEMHMHIVCMMTLTHCYLHKKRSSSQISQPDYHIASGPCSAKDKVNLGLPLSVTFSVTFLLMLYKKCIFPPHHISHRVLSII